MAGVFISVRELFLDEFGGAIYTEVLVCQRALQVACEFIQGQGKHAAIFCERI